MPYKAIYCLPYCRRSQCLWVWVSDRADTYCPLTIKFMAVTIYDMMFSPKVIVQWYDKIILPPQASKTQPHIQGLTIHHGCLPTIYCIDYEDWIHKTDLWSHSAPYSQ